MSLIHWWPLTKNLLDKVDISPLTGTYVMGTNGKIGPCLRTTSSLSCSKMTINDINPLTTSSTLTCWLRVNKEEITEVFSKISSSYNAPTSTILGYNSYGGLALTWTANSYTDFSSFRVVGSVRGNVAKATSSYTVPFDTWVHIAYVINQTTKKIVLYINGEKYGSEVDYSGITSMKNLTGNFFINSAQIYSGNGPSTSLPMDLSDIRVYNHALNDLEVKELAKGLALQYNFNNMYAEPTDNLISGLKSGGRTTYDSTNMTITTAGLNQDTYFYLLTSEALVEGVTYTLSCWGENIGEGLQFAFGMQGQSSAHHIFTIKDGYNEFTFSANSYVAGLTSILMDDTSRTGWQNNAVFSKFQLEKRDYATPYTRDYREGLGIEDESGYGHDTTVYNNSALTIDTNSGSFGFRTRGSEDRTAHANCSYLKCDLGASITPSAFTISFNAKVNIFGAQVSGVLSLNINGTEPTNYLDSTFVQYDSNFRLNNSVDSTQKNISAGIVIKNEWHHYALTWDGKILKGYRDGSQYANDVAADFIPDPFRYVYLGYDRAGGAGRDADVTWGDFRLYMTALGAEEIWDLAKTKGYITKNSEIMCGEIIEDCADVLITEKAVLETKELYEDIYPGYDLVEYIQSSGAQYIDTGYISTSSDYTYELDMAWTGTNVGAFESFMGYMASSTNPRAAIHKYSSVLMFGGNATTNSSIAPVKDERFWYKGHFKSGDQKLYKNGELIASNKITFDHSGNTLSAYIFARNNSGKNLSIMRLYEANIYEGDELVRHYIPVRQRSDGKLGVYETFEKKFFGNSGSGEFSVGATYTEASVAFYEGGYSSANEFIEF